MDEFATWVEQLGLTLTAAQLDQFARYEVLLLEWNERISLTAIREPREIRVRHFLDALTCATVTGPLDGLSLIDVGSGAGFPGLPLKILYPGLKLTLVDSVAKKTRFLQAVVEQLNLTEVTLLSERAETLGRSAVFREQFDWATARAVAELRILVELLLPLVRVGGHMLAQKGAGLDEDLPAASIAIDALGGGAARVETVRLPEMEQAHQLVVIPKLAATADRYPRRPGIPAKRPL